MEIMDYPLMNSISKALGYAHYLNNPWFQLYGYRQSVGVG